MQIPCFARGKKKLGSPDRSREFDLALRGIGRGLVLRWENGTGTAGNHDDYHETLGGFMGFL